MRWCRIRTAEPRWRPPRRAWRAPTPRARSRARCWPPPAEVPTDRPEVPRARPGQPLMKEMKSERGFTLIELLVVILIVGILAAIGMATFLNQRSKGQDTEAKAAASLIAKTLIMYEHDERTFATANSGALIALEPA